MLMIDADDDAFLTQARNLPQAFTSATETYEAPQANASQGGGAVRRET